MTDPGSTQKFRVTPQERDTNPLWQRLAKHLQTRVATLRARNDANLDAVATAMLRGAIAECLALLAAAENAPPVEAPYHDSF